MNRLARDTRGAAYVEFLISFIPVFLMFLGMVQMGLMFVAGLAVQRAASTAARAAIVVLDDDPQHYGNEARMQIGGGSGGGGSAESGVVGFLGLGGDSGGTSSFGSSSSSSARLSAIRSAASIPLFAVAPPPSALLQPSSVMAAIGNHRTATGMPPSRAAAAILWNMGGLEVRLVDGPASGTDQTSFTAAPLHEDNAVPTPVRVRVTYLFHCGVPLANRLMCHDPLALLLGANGAAAARALTGGPMTIERLQQLNREREAEQARMGRSQVGWDDLGDTTKSTIGAMGLAAEMMGRSFRVKVMSAEAQLPIHYANYDYQSE
jgi:hypothetical protein